LQRKVNKASDNEEMDAGSWSARREHVVTHRTRASASDSKVPCAFNSRISSEAIRMSCSVGGSVDIGGVMPYRVGLVANDELHSLGLYNRQSGLTVVFAGSLQWTMWRAGKIPEIRPKWKVEGSNC
jgi:hypothetical protein